LKIKVTSVFVDDQAKALDFYTKNLGFVKKTDISLGQYRWLTVVSPEGPQDIELLLEPNANPAAATFQKAIHDQGIPAAQFFVDDIQGEYKRLVGLGVSFRGEPKKAGPATIAILDDTCGNLIQIVQL
jgi:catechol 2,3-dioxygenase-like lactoylglutathione lyase family enzyme